MPKKARILIVEDNREVSKVLAAYLETRGYPLTFAYDGPSGLSIARKTLPDLVLLNFLMPGMTGLDVLRRLRSDPKTAGLKVIVTSGHSPIAEQAPAAGAQDVIIYPVSQTSSSQRSSAFSTLGPSRRPTFPPPAPDVHSSTPPKTSAGLAAPFVPGPRPHRRARSNGPAASDCRRGSA